jgi:hypothetical protein
LRGNLKDNIQTIFNIEKKLENVRKRRMEPSQKRQRFANLEDGPKAQSIKQHTLYLFDCLPIKVRYFNFTLSFQKNISSRHF